MIIAVDDHSEPKAQFQSLATQTLSSSDFEVIVFDSQPDGLWSKEWARARGTYARHVNLRMLDIGTTNRAESWNRGVQEANSDLLLLLADDYVGGPNIVAEHIRQHQLHPGQRDVVVGVTEFPSNPPPSRFMRWLDQSGALHGTRLPDEEKQVPARHFYGANTSLWRPFLKSVGPYDPGFEHQTTDDYEMGRRLARAGMRLYFAPAARAVHKHVIRVRERRKMLYWTGEALAHLERVSPQDMPPPGELLYPPLYAWRWAVEEARAILMFRENPLHPFFRNILLYERSLGYRHARRQKPDGRGLRRAEVAVAARNP